MNIVQWITTIIFLLIITMYMSISHAADTNIDEGVIIEFNRFPVDPSFTHRRWDENRDGGYYNNDMRKRRYNNMYHHIPFCRDYRGILRCVIIKPVNYHRCHGGYHDRYGNYIRPNCNFTE